MPTIYCKKSKFLVVGRFRKTVSSVGFDCIPLLIVMGQDLSKQANRLSIAAVSHITQFDRDDLLELRTAFEAAVKPTPDTVKKVRQSPAPSSSSKERVEPNLSRDDFNIAVDRANFYASDRAILDRLFTMMDKTGDDVINGREFLVGVAPLVKGNLTSKLACTTSITRIMFEVDAKGFRFLVTTMTTVASYFGDPPMTKKDVAALTADSPWKVLRLVHALLLFEHGNATGDGFVKILVALEVEFPSVDGQERRVGGGRRVDELR
ncbi:hypothetical protein DYB38_006552 [Aphanomyces astaci]|uniref:EF-hand domain-containing protein n=1 Tax=Aphanomyces astaci TaxID=112090 RepID=A0A397C001_APHAT|nr:hypothetical protein DYB38_006552 [Aphanomyces astaci]